jgi:hypothetical protein
VRTSIRIPHYILSRDVAYRRGAVIYREVQPALQNLEHRIDTRLIERTEPP